MKLGSIQFLRAIASLLVVYAHSIDLQMIFAHSFQQDFYYWPNFGAFGVDIFFVISGFIITWSAGRYQGIREGVYFLIRRFKRVNPIYYLATLLLVIICLPLVTKYSLIITFPNILKSLVLLPVSARERFSFPLLFPGWTLSFEWLFYLFFFLAICSRTRFKPAFLVLLLTALVTTGILFKGFEGSDYRLSFITNPILLEFGLGVGICWCYTNTRLKISRTMALAFLLTGTGICIYEIFKGFGDISEVYNIVDGSLALIRFIKWGIPAGLLVTGCIFLEKAHTLGTIWNNRFIALLGDASYSLYLINYPVYALCAAVYRRTGFFLNPDLAIGVQFLLALLGGLIFYKVAEKPLLKLLHQRLHPGPVS